MAITLNGDSGITNVNGTAAAPAITGTDTDSGMYFGTNTVALSTSGVTVETLTTSAGIPRIQADWSQSTIANRTAIQTSTTNGGTIVNFIPNGTGSGAVLDVYSASDLSNSSRFRFGNNGTACYIAQQIQGTGTFLPINFDVGATTQMSIATDGTITSTLGGMQVRSGTAVAATGTAIDFTGIPSWVRRITVMFDAVSTNGASNILVRLGTAASGILTTGYASTGSAIQGTAVGANSFTTGFAMSNTDGASASYVRYGQMTISRQREDQIWTFSSILGVTGAASARTEHGAGAGSTAGGALDRIRITTANGTDTFDIGFFNILFE
jgi:hypothetical protein